MVAFRSASEEISQYFKQGVEIPQFFFPLLRYNISKLLLTVFHRVNSIHPVQDALFLLVVVFFFLFVLGFFALPSLNSAKQVLSPVLIHFVAQGCISP